jgi:hypothetical protein
MQRKLTFEKDRLIAISGIAKYVVQQGKLNDEYYAGIFKSMLPHALLWKLPHQGVWIKAAPGVYERPMRGEHVRQN